METLRYLQISANELDDIIKKITELTTQTAEVFKLEDKPYSAAVNLGNQ
jgi:hypothetical protein